LKLIEQVSTSAAGTSSILADSRDGRKGFSHASEMHPPIYSKLFCWFILFYTHQINPSFKKCTFQSFYIYHTVAAAPTFRLRNKQILYYKLFALTKNQTHTQFYFTGIRHAAGAQG